MRLPLALLIACLLAGSSVAVSRAVRAEFTKADSYAKAIAACLNNRGFMVGQRVGVVCQTFEHGPAPL